MAVQSDVTWSSSEPHLVTFIEFDTDVTMKLICEYTHCVGLLGIVPPQDCEATLIEMFCDILWGGGLNTSEKMAFMSQLSQNVLFLQLKEVKFEKN